MRDIERLVVFAILMENGRGIVAKSPEYIDEKYELAMRTVHPWRLLDINNQRKLDKWVKTWRREET